MLSFFVTPNILIECSRLHKTASQHVDRLSVAYNDMEKSILHCRVLVYRSSTFLSTFRGFKHMDSSNDVEECFHRAFSYLHDDIIPFLQDMVAASNKDAGDLSEADRLTSVPTSSFGKSGTISKSWGKATAKSCAEDVLLLSVSLALLQAKMCYFAGDCIRAIATLRYIEDEIASMEEILPSLKKSVIAQLHNNMACVHMKSGKWTLCEFHINKSIINSAALSEQSAKQSELPPSSEAVSVPVSASALLHSSDGDSTKCRFPLSLPCDSYRLSVTLYNKALLSLRGGRPMEAFTAFQIAARCSVISGKPFIWIRMAECSIHQDLLEKDDRADKTPLTAESLISTKLFPSLRSPRISLSIFDPDQRRSANTQAGSPMSLFSAVSYLQHALITISGKFGGKNIHVGVQDLQDDKIKNSEADYDEDLLQSVVLKISYVYLKLNEPDNALKYLTEIFSIHESRVIRLARSLGEDLPEEKRQQQDQTLYLAYCYYITALAAAGREEEALNTLAEKRDVLITLVATADVLRSCYVPQYLSAVHNGNSSGSGTPRHMQDNKHLAAITLQVNKAILLIASDELEQAESLIDESLHICQVSGHRGCFHAVRCSLYLCIRRGKNAKALRLLQQFRQAPIL